MCKRYFAWTTRPPCETISPVRVKCALFQAYFPTCCTRPPVRCKAPAGRACLFARCAYAVERREALLRPSALQAPDGKVGQSGPISLPLVRASRAFEPIARRGTPAHAALFSLRCRHAIARGTCSFAWTTSPPCKQSSPFRVKCAMFQAHFPTSCTRPPVRCQAPTGRACYFARCPYAV